MIFFLQGNQDNQGKQGDSDNQNGQGNGSNQNGQGNNDNEDQDKPNTENNRRKVVCRTETCESIMATVPIEVRAHTDIGNITLKCKRKHIKETGRQKGAEETKHIHKFEIVQEVFARIPIDFITEVAVKEEKVDFDVHECKK